MDNIEIKTASGETVTLRTVDVDGVQVPANMLVDYQGNIVGGPYTIPVYLVQGDDPLRVRQTRNSSTPTQTQVDVGTTSVEILAANPDRVTATIHNHSSEQIYISVDDPASNTNFIEVLQEHDSWEMPIRSEYTGAFYAARPEGSVTTDPVAVTEFVV